MFAQANPLGSEREDTIRLPGHVRVTLHAWRRWMQRAPYLLREDRLVAGRYDDERVMYEALLRVWLRAREDTRLQPGTAAYVRRLIDSGGRDACYLYDDTMRLRPVLSIERDEIITIEQDKFNMGRVGCAKPTRRAWVGRNRGR